MPDASETDPAASSETHLVGGPERRFIELADYDPAWPQRFETERERIVAALGPAAERVEHIGSTAVPGLAAKPIVDIMVTVQDPEDDAIYRQPLEDAGYELRVVEPSHRMFRTPGRDVHVHIWRAGGEDERRHLAFRDQLRNSPADRQLYESAKRELSGRMWEDTNDYADAKSPVISAIMERASREAGDV